MKFVCTQENLVAGLSKAAPLAGRNTQLPILQNILLQLKEGVLHITATDLEIGIHTVVPGKVEVEGSCTVVAKKFVEYIQQLPSEDPLRLSLTDTHLHVATTGFNAKFPTTSDEDFPLLPHLRGENPLTLSAAQFSRGLLNTLFAAARDETRPEIHSVFVVGEGKEIRMAATDSFRLAEHVLSSQEEKEPFSLLLPLHTAQEIVRLFSAAETLEIFPHESHITIQSGDTELSSRLVDGKYPDYQQIIPRSFVAQGTVARQALLRALKTLTVFLPRDSRRVQVLLKPTEGKLLFTVGSGEAGAGDVELEFEGKGKDLTILFNLQYLLEGIQAMTGTTITTKFVGGSDPAVFSPAGTKEQYQYIVMPIQA